MKNLSIILLFLISIRVNSQVDSTETKDKRLFEEAIDYSYDEIYDSALLYFEKILIDFPKSELRGRAHYNIGYIYFKMKEYDKSKTIFLSILKSDYNEYEAYSLMEQYTLFKHRSCEYLAEIFLDEGNFKEAEKYVRLFDKKYPYKHFCGNEIAAYEIYRSRCYARVFEGEKSFKKAMDKLLPFLFDWGLASNDKLISDLIRVTDKYCSKDKIKEELEKAKKSLTMKTNRHAEFGIIELFGKKVKVCDAGIYDIYEPETYKNLELKGIDKYKKAIEMNRYFKEYLK
jgi:tetratricopeptide (TPR) repeat protein